MMKSLVKRLEELDIYGKIKIILKTSHLKQDKIPK